jgi:predicted dehydrogenase
MAKYRVGVIGCGGISRTHTRGFNALQSAEVVAAADISKESVDKFGEEFSVSARYTDFREMLQQEQPDIVSVCTWPGTHAEATIAAAESNVKGILCEKPMCINLGEADAMIEACEKSGTKLAIGHHSRFIARNTAARNLIAEGVIGQPTLMIRRVGGGLLNNGSHAVDLMRYLLSDPQTKWVIGQVERKTDRYERALRVEDLCMGLICFAGGTRGIIESDMPESGMPSGTFLYGTEGILNLGGDNLLLQNPKQAGWQAMDVPPDTNQFAEMIEWIEGRSGHRNDAKQTRYTIEILMAIYESLRIKGLVKMPLETKESPLHLMIDDGALPIAKPGKYDIRLPEIMWNILE